MNKKAGRPPLPKGQSKDAQIAVRFNPAYERSLDESAERTGATKAEVVRQATIQELKRPSIWMKPTKWKREELNDQYIRFNLTSPDHQLAGIGKLDVRENPLGEIAVDIFVDEGPRRGVLTRIWLSADTVIKIEANRGEDAGKIKFTLAA